MDPTEGADLRKPVTPFPTQNPGIPELVPNIPTIPPIPQAPGANTSVSAETQSIESLSSGDGVNKKKVFVIGGVVVLMLLVIGGAIYFAPRISSMLAKRISTKDTAEVTTAVPTQAPKLASAKVSYLEGDVWSVTGDQKSPIYEDAEVTEGDILETGEDAKVVLALEGGSILRLGPSTKITLTNLDSLDLSFSQDSGVLFAYVEKGVGRFMVTAGDVTVEAVGTAFSVDKQDEVQVNVFESSVKVKEGEVEAKVEENNKWVQGESAPVALASIEVSSDNFLQWALEEEIQRMEADIISQVTVPENKEDKEAYIAALKEITGDKKELLKKAFQATTSGKVSSITLTGQVTGGNALSLSWTADGLASDGFKVVWSKTLGKPYPGDKRLYNPLYGYQKTLGPMKPGSGTWYFRVCEWGADTCGVYSNELSFSF